jgi:DNA-binding SARP family transcriptional activator/cytochrome c-type biogenesis protein CcmH/NrfG
VIIEMNDTKLFDIIELNSHPSASPSLTIRLLGPFELFAGDRPVAPDRWPRRKPKLLVKLLALQPRAQLHREQIIDTLWPDADFEAGVNNLHKAIHAARRALEPDLRSGSNSRFIGARDNIIALRAPGDLWIDACVFERKAMEAMRSDDPKLFEAAIDLYRGDLLPEDLYEDWAAAPREKTRGLYLDLLFRLARLREEGGDHVGGMGLLQSLLAADPTNEEAHQRLMNLYATIGNRHGAFRQYHQCIGALRREAGVEPGRTTIEIYNRISARAPNVAPPQEEVAGAVVEKLYLGMTRAEKKSLRGNEAPDEEALELYLKGRYCWLSRSGKRMMQAAGYFERAIALAPDYALAWSGLADAYNLMASYGVLPPETACLKAMKAASRAIELNPNLAEAHAAMGYLQGTYSWDYAAGAESLSRAIELKPLDPIFHQWYGVLIISAYNEVEPGLAAVRRALQLDPVSILNRASLGWCLYFARRHDEAMEVLKQTIELDSNIHVPYLYLGRVYWQKGMFAEAVECFRQAVSLSNGDLPIHAELIAARAMAGDRDEARRLLDELQASSSQKYLSPYYLALIHLGLGDDEKMFALLETAYKERVGQLFGLNVEPRFDRLRNYSRFRNLLERLGY